MSDQTFADYLSQFKKSVSDQPSVVVEGRLTRIVGMTLEAVGCSVNIGERCHIETNSGKLEEAEVVGFSEDKIFLMPIGNIHGLGPGARVVEKKWFSLIYRTVLSYLVLVCLF